MPPSSRIFLPCLMAKDQLMELVDPWSSVKSRKNIATDAASFVSAAVSSNVDVHHISEDMIMMLNEALNTAAVFQKAGNIP